MTCIAPMPTVEMKRRSSTSCVKGQYLHSCHRSNKKSKGSYSLVKTTQQADKTDILIESPDDACPIVMFSGQSIEINKASDCVDKLDGTSTHLRKLPYSSPPDPISSERTGSLYSTCPSDLQTIFSPSFEIENAQNKMINQKDADSNEQNTLPHLVSDDSDDGSCSSSDFLLYGELDFCKFEDLATSQFIGDMGFTDYALDSIYTDFEHVNTNTMIDMTDRYMMLPFLEKAVETSSIQNEDSVRAMVDCDDACLYLAMHQMKSDQETNINYQFGELDEMECIDQQLIFRNLPDLFETASSVCPVWIQTETQDKKLITLVLDLDETLVHSTLEHCDDAAFSFPVFFNMKQHTVYVRQRPYLQLFLERVAQMFDVVIFTASQSIYAEQLLDILDPERNLISQRIYRESCIFSNGTYTKDLTVLGIDLAKVAIIDNSPQVFRLQVNNGIPIKSWFDDQSDSALISLLPFLETLVDADDVRPVIAKKFGSEE